MQHYTMVFITINAVRVSGGSSANHQELDTVYTASGVCQAQQTPNAVYKVLSSWRWAEESPEACRAFIVINIIV